MIPSCLNLVVTLKSFNPLFLAHRVFAFNENSIGIMDNSIQYGIGQGFFTDLTMPAGRSELTDKDSRSLFAFGFYYPQ